MINFNTLINPRWEHFKNAFLGLLVGWCIYGITTLIEQQNIDINIEAPRQFMAPLKELEGPDVFSNNATI